MIATSSSDRAPIWKTPPENGRPSRPSGNGIWKSVVAGLCGSITHSLLMYFKSWAGLLPSFEPYESLQTTLSHVTGTAIHPVVPWLLSFLNGSTFVSLAFGYLYRWLPGRIGATKGMAYGVLGWAVMGMVFFPAIGLGIFAFQVGLGISPALFSLAMLLAYSVILGMVYDALN
jgi:hypothetical protein